LAKIVLNMREIFRAIAKREAEASRFRPYHKKRRRQPEHLSASDGRSEAHEPLNRSNVREATAAYTPWTRLPPPFKALRLPPAIVPVPDKAGRGD
jgi:hypothetical protein